MAFVSKSKSPAERAAPTRGGRGGIGDRGGLSSSGFGSKENGAEKTKWGGGGGSTWSAPCSCRLFPAEFREVVDLCLRIEVDERPTARELLHHAWVAGLQHAHVPPTTPEAAAAAAAVAMSGVAGDLGGSGDASSGGRTMLPLPLAFIPIPVARVQHHQAAGGGRRGSGSESQSATDGSVGGIGGRGEGVGGGGEGGTDTTNTTNTTTLPLSTPSRPGSPPVRGDSVTAASSFVGCDSVGGDAGGDRSGGGDGGGSGGWG